MVDTANKVREAINTTKSFIYGTSTLLGEEGSLDYLLALREYVQERIKAEAESWRPERDRKIEEYKESLSKRAEQYKSTIVLESPFRGQLKVQTRDTRRLRKTM